MKTRYWILGGTVFLLFLVFRYLLPLVLPFALAYLCAKIVAPVIRFFTEKLKWKKKVTVILIVVVTVGTLVCFVGYVGSLAIGQLIQLLQKIPVYGQMADRTLEEICCRCDQMLDLAVGTSYRYVEVQTTQMYRSIGNDILPKLSSCAAGVFNWLVGAGVGIFVFFVSTLLILLDDSFPKVPGRYQPFVRRLKTAGLAYIKAQGIIMFLIAIVMGVGLLLMKNDYAVLLGIGIAIFDAVPVMGSGLILVPWSLVQMARGDFFGASVLLTLFVVATFLREIMEPRLLGKGLGMKPFFVLMAVYVGSKLFGLGGILLGPVALAVLKATDDVLRDE